MQESDKPSIVTRWAITATTFEMLCLWQEWHDRVDWPGRGCVGEVISIHNDAGLDMRIAAFVDNVMDTPVTFVEWCSDMRSYLALESWLKRYYEKYTDAMNFHNCIHDLKGRK